MATDAETGTPAYAASLARGVGRSRGWPAETVAGLVADLQAQRPYDVIGHVRWWEGAADKAQARVGALPGGHKLVAAYLSEAAEHASDAERERLASPLTQLGGAAVETAEDLRAAAAAGGEVVVNASNHLPAILGTVALVAGVVLVHRLRS